jgi:hypothetical protein
VKYIFFYFIFSFFFLNSYSQNKEKKFRSHIGISKGDTIAALKKITFCNCLVNGFPIDSLQYKDPSIYILLEEINCSFSFLDTINVYTEKFMKPYLYHRTGQNKENTHNKRIMLGCIELYNSKGLDIYLRRFYKLNKDFFPL